MTEGIAVLTTGTRASTHVQKTPMDRSMPILALNLNMFVGGFVDVRRGVGYSIGMGKKNNI